MSAVTVRNAAPLLRTINVFPKEIVRVWVSEFRTCPGEIVGIAEVSSLPGLVSFLNTCSDDPD